MRAIDRAAAILSCFNETDHELTLQEISERSSLHKATALRILSTLVRNGLVHQIAPSGPYALGYGILKIADAVLYNNPLWCRAQPIIQSASQEIGEALLLSSQRGDHVVHLDQGVGRHSIYERAPLGVCLAAHTCSAGLSMLGMYDSEQAEQYVKRHAKNPEERATIQKLIRKAQASYRAQGCLTLAAGELGDNAALAIAFQIPEQPAGALSFSIPDTRMSRNLAERCTRFLIKVRDKIEMAQS